MKKRLASQNSPFMWDTRYQLRIGVHFPDVTDNFLQSLNTDPLHMGRQSSETHLCGCVRPNHLFTGIICREAPVPATHVILSSTPKPSQPAPSDFVRCRWNHEIQSCTRGTCVSAACHFSATNRIPPPRMPCSAANVPACTHSHAHSLIVWHTPPDMARQICRATVLATRIPLFHARSTYADRHWRFSNKHAPQLPLDRVRLPT